jgi:hypothetical protein
MTLAPIAAARQACYSLLLFIPAAILFLEGRSLEADQLRYDSARDWGQWRLPLGAVDLTADGLIAPTQIRRNTDAVRDALKFGGGIRNAGSNRTVAALVMHGDPATGWAPDPQDEPDDWFIEIDLGRGVSANSVTLTFAEEAPPFSLFDLLLSTGEPETDNIAAPVPGTLVYRVKERFKENGRHRVTYAIAQADEGPVQYVRFQPLLMAPGARLTEVEVAAIGDNIALGMIERGGTIDIVVDLALSSESVPLGNSIALVDGDLYERWNYGRASRGANDIDAHMILDLGAVYWVDLVRVIGGVVVRSGFGGGITTNHYVSRRRWGFRFYELMTSDGSLSPDGSRIWTKHFSGHAPGSETTRGLVDHHFDLIPTRYLRIFWKFWDTSCFTLQRLGEEGGVSLVPGCGAGGTTDEIQIFGAGFPQQVSFRSPLIDLRDRQSLNSVEWSATAPPGTRVEIRTRTGDQVVENYTFYDKNGKEVTKEKWEKLIPSFRGPIDTAQVAGADWSPWSNIYSSSGQEFQSPSPRRYLELDVRLVSDSPEQAAALDFLAVNFTPPLARQALGEIYPLEARPGVPTQFAYFLRPKQTTGFDRLEVESTAPLRFVDVSLDGVPLEAQADTTAAGFQVQLPGRVRSDQLVELRFESSVFLQSTRFDVFLQDSRQAREIRQRVDPGDATDRVESSTNVVGLPVSRNVLANVQLSSRAITPNGDGVNDQLRLSVDLVNVLETRPLRLRLYDLAGRLIHQQEAEGRAGQQHFFWNGQGAVPGLYIVEVHLEGDAGDATLQQLVSVVY